MADPLIIRGGKVLTPDGTHVTANEECCCGGEEVECAACDGGMVPNEVLLTVGDHWTCTGAGNCNSWVGDFVLSILAQTASVCSWSIEIDRSCGNARSFLIVFEIRYFNGVCTASVNFAYAGADGKHWKQSMSTGSGATCDCSDLATGITLPFNTQGQVEDDCIWDGVSSVFVVAL